MQFNVVRAIFKRNFVGYFSSPIGYVFICAMVLMSAFAAFWPNEFFNANLANLDQLNQRLPWIMLVFVPAVTMGTWAMEREHGTDELLLTLPTRDLDVVLGKYLAALGIFTVALLFSLSNVAVLMWVGSPDVGLLFANYLGYWFVGVGMIAVGMVASFLTSNLTVAFIMAVAFNAPLVFAAHADVIHGREMAQIVKSFSIAYQFSDFGRGVVSLSSVVYFASMAAVMLYVSIVLIRRRHWAGQRAMSGHFTVRTLALVSIAVGINVLANRFDRRLDVTSEKLSSLSPETIDVLDKLDPDRPVYVEVYISPQVPESYVQTRLDLLAMLREVDSLGGDRVIVRINPTESFSASAAEAQEQFGITARSVQSSSGGKFAVDDVFLGVAFMCGLDKVVVPFFDRGISVEYEVVRSIGTVSQQQRKRIGVVGTDAQLFGGFDMQSMSSRPVAPIIEELNKQYETQQVSAASPIADDVDALLVVQPSTLPQDQLDNLVDAIRRGIPTAIYEDPFPVQDARVAGTSQPRVPAGGNNPFMNRSPPVPKGDIRSLWSLLQVVFSDREIVWEDYNPFPKLPELRRTPELVFIDDGSGAPEPFNQSVPITSGLQQVLLMFPGYLRQQVGATLAFTPLLITGTETGVMPYDEMVQRTIFGAGGINPNRRHRPTRQPYTLGAYIHGSLTDEGPDIRVVLCGDIDMLYSVFFMLRARGSGEGNQLDLNFDNVTLVLNTLDFLAGDDRFIEIRKRRPVHRTLTRVEKSTRGIVETANQDAERFRDEFEQKQAQQRAKFDADISKLQQRPGVDVQQMILEVQAAVKVNEDRLRAITERLESDRDKQIKTSERELALEIRSIQGRYKFAAVLVPPIPPLALAVVVFGRRRRLERISVPAQRMRGDAEGSSS